MIELPVLRAVPAELRVFGSQARPLRPSKVAKLLGCSMAVVLTMSDEGIGNGAAQTGNLVHDAAEAYHKVRGSQEDRVQAGLAALAAARSEFPDGDPAKADKIFRAYAADPENQDAVCLWVEAPVRLVLPAAPGDPTGEPIVIEGTLDQVRKHPDGRKRVWDIKTGGRLTADESVTEYLIQQATYTLAAIATLDPEIEPGGLIYTPGYEKSRGRRHVELPLTVESCKMILAAVPARVADVRRGVPTFTPSLEACRWCDMRPWPRCASAFTGFYGSFK
jgi:hypothetical protein